MKKNKKGFTLIELLAVIVILAIIALIAIPIVLNIIERARKGAVTRSAENVLKASNLYYTNSLLDVKQPEDIRFECSNNECLSSKLDENGNPINLNVDGNIGEGYVLITNKGEVEFLLQNGSYCAIKYQATKNISVKNETCDNIDITNDETVPVIDKINTVVKTNSITVTVSAYDNESGISGYQFSIDNGTTWTEYQTNNVHTFNNLTNDKTYKIRVRVYNGTYGKETFEEAKGMSEQETEEISLKQIEEPTFEITPEGWSTSKTVTITYPEGYTNEYSIDNGNTFVPYTEAITVTENGNIIARVTDGNNIITKTQIINNVATNYITNGLVLQYDGYTKPENGKWKDLTGSGNDGILNNFDSSYNGEENGIKFDGIDDFISANNPVFNEVGGHPNMTIEVILKQNSWNKNKYQAPFALGHYVNQKYFMNIWTAHDGRELEIQFEWNGITGTDQNVTVGDKYQLNNSYSISFGVNGNNGFAYFNNENIYNETLTFRNGWLENSLLLGKPHTGRYFFDGYIYAVRIYNRALTEDEISNNYALDKARFNVE